VTYGIVHSQPEPLTALRASIPLELDRITSKALAKDPGERYAHIENLPVMFLSIGPTGPQNLSGYSRPTNLIIWGHVTTSLSGNPVRLESDGWLYRLRGGPFLASPVHQGYNRNSFIAC